MTNALIWFRNDLRLQDNPALSAACDHDAILPLYILDTAQEWAPGGASKWWLHQGLKSLSTNLGEQNVSLILKSGDPLGILKALIQKHHITHLYWNRCYEPYSIARDQQIKENLRTLGVTVKSFNSHLLYEPWTIKNGQNLPYKVFTPFWKSCLTRPFDETILPTPSLPKAITAESETIENWQLEPQNPDWAGGFRDRWTATEKGAHQQLEQFINSGLLQYAKGRDFPQKQACSNLSPYLHYGQISPRQIWARLRQEENSENKRVFLSEIGWREFSYYLLYHFPRITEHVFMEKFKSFPWDTNPAQLKAWQKGQTGYPLVDAGMRELWHTGVMHNRVRMVVASFLTKHLGISWQEGAAWFWDCLVDADLASNSASWQWVAGCGADAAPYFRIFNPITQSEKFDKEGHYIRQWVPELAKLPAKHIHKPWEAPEDILKNADIKIGKDYPAPIVEHTKAREQALEKYAALA